jgi:hypothetical protein
MDLETRIRVAYAAATGAYIELMDKPDIEEAQGWISLRFPRAEQAKPMACAQLLLLAVEANPGISPDVLWNIAAQAYGGKFNLLDREPACRRAAFTVFRAVAAVLPRDVEPAYMPMGDFALKQIDFGPRGLFAPVRGLLDDAPAATPEPVKPAKKAKA